MVTVPKRFTEAHAIVQGPPGSGKSRTIFNTQLIERLGTSAIVTEVTAGEDLTPTVYGITAGYRAKNGHCVYYLNPADLDNSTRFNPIDFIDGIDDAIYYADLIITNTTFQNHVGDQIWAQSEHHLLTALLLYAWGLGGKEKSVEGGKSNLGHIRSLLRLGPGDLGGVVAQNGIPEAKAQFHEFLRNSSPNFRLGVFSGLIQRLNPWLNPRICALTEVTDFDPEELRNSLFTFYLAYPVHRRDYRPIMSLALNFLTRLPLRTKFKYPMTYLLDEFAAYGRVPGIDDMQATIRNRQIGIVFGFQDLQQLTKVYSQHEAEVIFTNCDTKITFATGSPKAQTQMSQLLGQTTRVKKTVSSSGHINRQTYGAPLLSPADVGRIPNGQVLVVRNKRNPILLSTCDSGKYEHYAQIFPLPRGKQKAVAKNMYYECAGAKNLAFSPAAAQEQIQRFELCLRNRTAALAALKKAKKLHASASQILELRQRFEKANGIYLALFGKDIAMPEQRPTRDSEEISTTRGVPPDSTPPAASLNVEEKSIQEPYEYFSAADHHMYDYIPDSDV
jgi:type IV secretory pathway TraG/TraD family ATPase VirD4